MQSLENERDADVLQSQTPLTNHPAQEEDDKTAGKRQKSSAAFRTISEVADELDVQQHVLRFWETKFSQVRPLKRGGGRRYYRPEDIELLKKIHHLLYTEKYTIKGVQKLLREKGKRQLLNEETQRESSNNNEAAEDARAIAQAARKGLSLSQRAKLETTLNELKALRNAIKSEDEE
ncbi:MAG: MerR family transcriptional regulator [Alphaproteobacteria bacterium]|nr:MerR family transcriptional regulator [Alphaproteobacteria bacterium]